MNEIELEKRTLHHCVMCMRLKEKGSVSESMGMQNCCNLHFINAIRGNVVIKECNMNAFGKPPLLFKTVKDILKKQDSCQFQPSTHSLQQSCPEEVCDTVEKGNAFLPVVDRSLQEVESKGKEFDCLGVDNKVGSIPEEHFSGEMTLKQLKENCKTKKRKRANSISTKAKQPCVKLEPDEDSSDLQKPLIALKSKLPKAKRKCVRAAGKSRQVGIKIKSEKAADTEKQLRLDSILLGQVKEEVPEPNVYDIQTINLRDNSSAREIISNLTLETTECENIRPVSFSEEYRCCVLNQISYDHLEDIEPSFQTIPTNEGTIDPSYDEKSFQRFCYFPTSEFDIQENLELIPNLISTTKDQSSEIKEGSSSCFSLHNLVGKSCSTSPVTGAPSLTVDDCADFEESYHGCDSLPLENSVHANFSPEKQLKGPTSSATAFSSSESHYSCSTTDDELYSSKDSATVATNCLAGSHLVLSEEDCSLDEQVDNSMAEENKFSPSCVDNENTLKKVRASTPERLLLTRKVVSPSSQERISLVMSSKQLHDQSDWKGNICVGNKAGNAVLSVAEAPKSSGSVTQMRSTASPSILKKLKNGRRNSLPKGNLGGPRLSQSLPKLSTGCTSLKGCSESAIAFSQRQMHDIESLAMKLMSELKSMKDVMEGKLLVEALQTIDSKCEAEEVKKAITNATKVEETTRRWLSMMARDCNRFCKIMSLKQHENAAADATNNNLVEREGKKITFADEAGGALCHVKFFEDDMKIKADVKYEHETQ